MSVKKLGKPTIIVNSYQAAYDLLEKRSSIYSDRPHFVMLRDLYVISIMTLTVYYPCLFPTGWLSEAPHYNLMVILGGNTGNSINRI